MPEKLSHAVARFVAAQNVGHVFTVSGGGIMHLLDSFGREPGLRYTCNYHEQACAIAAEAYARRSGNLGVCLVTTGPGSTNALSAIAGAWVDSVPVLVISGQVRSDLIADYRYVRQMGPQEINIDDMARPVTKFFRTVLNPAEIRATLEEAVFTARSGRPGPVWVNVPLDVQGASIDWDALAPFVPPETSASAAVPAQSADAQVQAIVQRLRGAQRPVIVAGNGIHLADAHAALDRFVTQTGVPVVVPIGATDLLYEEHPAFQGRVGPLGQRRANFAVQNADLVLGLGASLSISSIGFNTDGFAPGADVVMVNIDAHEIEKARPRPVLGVVQDVAKVLEALMPATLEWQCPAAWKSACDEWWDRYPPLEVHPAAADPVNSYHFFSRLGEQMQAGDTLLTGNSLDAWSAFQTFANKPRQRLFTNINYGAMGWDLPAIVGARQAADGRVVLVTGDGSLLFNVQELMTIGHNRMDIKLFVLNNQGYESIRTTQRNYFQGNFVGSDASSGVANPDFAALAQAFGLAYRKIATTGEIDAGIAEAFAAPGPVLVELMLDPDQSRSPRVMSRRREDGTMESGMLHNMFPYLGEAEAEYNARFVPKTPKVRT
ncbi:MAG: thiamine pyrophosphate-binding protein [Pseudomonadota bacterium]